jgi:hypothetical protein
MVNNLGQTITSTTSVWWRVQWTCFGEPDTIDCQDTAQDTGNWSIYSGWPYNIERGITTTKQLALVDPWVTLTPAQRAGNWWKMLRLLPAEQQMVFNIDPRWLMPTNVMVTLKYKDIGKGAVTINGVTKQRMNTGNEVSLEFQMSGQRQYTLLVSGDILYLHGFEVSR